MSTVAQLIWNPGDSVFPPLEGFANSERLFASLRIRNPTLPAASVSADSVLKCGQEDSMEPGVSLSGQRQATWYTAGSSSSSSTGGNTSTLIRSPVRAMRTRLWVRGIKYGHGGFDMLIASNKVSPRMARSKPLGHYQFGDAYSNVGEDSLDPADQSGEIQAAVAQLVRQYVLIWGHEGSPDGLRSSLIRVRSFALEQG
ncbi:hypothetical protein POJ06DRAFT_266476 [Lipomyces tetrasporus]|uniref:Uncharacterized protein n=1 Tax=Lipomyces tetrasporus TaxID=54092 RepID=A0AAD7QV18_9ASCO|nr:uncharacterized protein POJ06DRAFT_266476 [Lipomyces tetrasporus]KAJ8101865.1 hypothetical protein POJ06DRAFT_266476 [Lipomyces tetrasporus]